jgi:hypothetical protein
LPSAHVGAAPASNERRPSGRYSLVNTRADTGSRKLAER